MLVAVDAVVMHLIFLTANADQVVQRLLIAPAALIVHAPRTAKVDVAVLLDAVQVALAVSAHYLKNQGRADNIYNFLSILKNGALKI